MDKELKILELITKRKPSSKNPCFWYNNSVL